MYFLTKQGMVVLMIFVLLALHALAGSPTWLCPNNTDTDVSKLKPYFDKGRLALTVMKDIYIFCLQTNVFTSFDNLLVSVNNGILAHFNTSRLIQNGRNFVGDNFQIIFVNRNCCFFIQMSLRYVSLGPLNNNKALLEILVWHQTANKPLSEPTMA